MKPIIPNNYRLLTHNDQFQFHDLFWDENWLPDQFFNENWLPIADNDDFQLVGLPVKDAPTLNYSYIRPVFANVNDTPPFYCFKPSTNPLIRTISLSAPKDCSVLIPPLPTNNYFRFLDKNDSFQLTDMWWRDDNEIKQWDIINSNFYLGKPIVSSNRFLKTFYIRPLHNEQTIFREVFPLLNNTKQFVQNKLETIARNYSSKI
jgi:hypothetical protein